MQRRGTARIPLQAQRPHQSACIQSRIRSCDYATLGSILRKPPNQSMPSHIFLVLKLNTSIPVSSLKLRRKTVSVSAIPVIV
jgi:hypothetical protein